jgi:hypothetical protein
MRPKARKSCPNCRRLQAKLDAQGARLGAKATVARHQEQLAAARKNSSISSNPPSTDIVKPPKPAPPEGQPGHPKHQRAAFPPEAINDASLDHRLDCQEPRHEATMVVYRQVFSCASLATITATVPVNGHA